MTLTRAQARARIIAFRKRGVPWKKIKTFHAWHIFHPAPPAPVRATRLSEAGLEFIARHEGCVLRPYNDAASPPNATIGVGHLIHPGPVTAADNTRYAGFTQADAIKLLRTDVARYEESVRALGLDLTAPEFDALCSFAFNLGTGALAGSSIPGLIKAGKKDEAMNVLKEYVHAGSIVLQGLVTRRNDEARLFLTGQYR